MIGPIGFAIMVVGWVLYAPIRIWQHFDAEARHRTRLHRHGAFFLDGAITLLMVALLAILSKAVAGWLS